MLKKPWDHDFVIELPLHLSLMKDACTLMHFVLFDKGIWISLSLRMHFCNQHSSWEKAETFILINDIWDIKVQIFLTKRAESFSMFGQLLAKSGISNPWAKNLLRFASCLKYQESVLREKEVRTCSMCGHMLARLAQWWLRCSVDNSMGTVWSGPPTPCNPRTDSPRSNPHSGLSRWIRWRQTCLLHYLTGCWQPFACSWRCSN